MKRVTLLAIIFNILLFLGAVGFISYQLSPVSTSQTEQTIVIPKGASISSIGNQLVQKGLIKSLYVFRFVVWKNTLQGSIQAGTFKVSPSQSVEEIAFSLTKGTDDTWVTLVEGWRNEEIAEELAQTFGPEFDTKKFLELAKEKQGYLFPNTYLFPKLSTPELIISTLSKTFEKQLGAEDMQKLEAQKRTLEQAVTMASLVEREARQPETMRMVAGILWKRLDAGWPLQVDATLQYAKGYDKKNKSWWSVPFGMDKSIKSVYNTYANPGLPPAPICNPGLNALKAVANPKESPYWYYITDDNGVMHYAETLSEHNANVKKYLQ